MKKRPIIFIIFVCIFLSSSYSQQKAEWKGTIKEENGTKVIKNPQWPMYGELKFELEEDLRIGNEEDDNYYFYRGFDFVVDAAGNIYIFDRADFRIQKFDMNGKYIQTIGRRGQGPGEFQDLFARLFLDSEGNLYVKGRRKIQKFNRQGEFENSIPLKMNISDFGVIGKDIILGKTTSNSPNGRMTEIALLNPEGEKFTSLTSQFNPRPDVGTSFVFSHPYGNRLYFCAYDKDLGIFGKSSEYKLFFMNSSGETIYVIEKEELPEKMSQEERNKPFDDLIVAYKKRGLKIDKGELEKISNLTEYKPFFMGIMRDDVGNIYVMKTESITTKVRETLCDLFNKEGHYLYKVKMPLIRELPGPRVVIKNGFFYQGDHDRESGMDFLKRYKIKNWDQIKKGI